MGVCATVPQPARCSIAAVITHFWTRTSTFLVTTELSSLGVLLNFACSNFQNKNKFFVYILITSDTLCLRNNTICTLDCKRLISLYSLSSAQASVIKGRIVIPQSTDLVRSTGSIIYTNKWTFSTRTAWNFHLNSRTSALHCTSYFRYFEFWQEYFLSFGHEGSNKMFL
jgi:hypothetical protein